MHLFLRSLLVTTSKAPVTTSVAPAFPLLTSKTRPQTASLGADDSGLPASPRFANPSRGLGETPGFVMLS